MEKPKVLFVQQEIVPYLNESRMGIMGRYLPQAIQEKGKEIRTFMPRYGCVNERRNQLHEVIRLSGMNLIINDMDHPLIIKVASIQSARMQIYFIDNDDYFQRKYVLTDKNNEFFKDNDERSIFFCKGVLETVKKLGWSPDIVFCSGWITSLLPLYIKQAYKDNPLFSETKVVYSIFDDAFKGSVSSNLQAKLKMEGVKDKYLSHYADPTFINMTKSAIELSDGVVIGSESVDPSLEAHASKLGKPILGFQSIDNYADAYSSFFDEILVHEEILSQ